MDTPTAAALLATLIATLVIGLLMGAAGIGGVLLAPWLTHAGGLPVQEAIGIAMLAFVGPGIAALLAARRTPTPRARSIRPLVFATVPGAAAGIAALALLPERAALLVLAACVTVVGLRLLVRTDAPAREAREPRDAIGGVPTGLFTGFASALTVTGGPMVLTPLLLWRGAALPDAIALGQLVQLPIAASATAANLLAGPVHVAAGVAIGVLLVPGMLLGRRLAGAMPRLLLARLVASLLLVAGLASVMKALR